MVWDRASDRPLRLTVVWQDRRIEPLCAQLRTLDGAPSRVRADTGLLSALTSSARSLKKTTQGAEEDRQRLWASAHQGPLMKLDNVVLAHPRPEGDSQSRRQQGNGPSACGRCQGWGSSRTSHSPRVGVPAALRIDHANFWGLLLPSG